MARKVQAMPDSLWRNIIVNADANKNSMYAMYPADLEYMSAYMESRGGPYGATLFVGLQAFLMEYLMKPLTVEDVHEAEAVLKSLGSHFNRQMWLDLINDHGGYLPIAIEAVPEGTVVPTRNVMLQVVNTDPKYAWLTSFIECALQRALWYPCTVGTVSWMAKQYVKDALARTSDHPERLRLFLHDYGARGSNSFESAALGGMAHLVNFDQSDTIPGYLAASKYYNAAAPHGAAMMLEHSNTMSFGQEHEADLFRDLLSRTDVEAVGLLTDTYDHDNVVETIVGKELRDEILAFPGVVVVRGDSGDPVKTPVDMVETLMETFEPTVNLKGFRVLPPSVRVVQGDGLTAETFGAIYAELERRGLAADNVLCGMGGGLLQAVTRDTLLFGYKANAICVDGVWRDVAKKPTGSTFKHSKAGRLALQYVDDDFRTVPHDSIPAEENQLVPVFRNGKLLRKWDFSELVERSERPTPAYYHQGLSDAVAAYA